MVVVSWLSELMDLSKMVPFGGCTDSLFVEAVTETSVMEDFSAAVSFMGERETRVVTASEAGFGLDTVSCTVALSI